MKSLVQENFNYSNLFLSGFGMTETTLTALTQSLAREIKPGSVGVLLPGTEGKIIDVDNGRLLGPNERGELCLKGPQIMKGYWNRPEATKNTIDEFGFLHTGTIRRYHSVCFTITPLTGFHLYILC